MACSTASVAGLAAYAMSWSSVSPQPPSAGWLAKSRSWNWKASGPAASTTAAAALSARVEYWSWRVSRNAMPW